MNTNAALSNESNMITTPWRVFSENGEKFRIRATYGWQKIGGQEPYWSVTAEILRKVRGRWLEDSGGCIHDVITKHFPELAPSIRWHLSDLMTGPMHYVANAVYWMQHSCGECSHNEAKKYLGYFKSTVVFGAIEEDELPFIDFSGCISHEQKQGRVPSAVIPWCMARLPALLAKMKEETDAALALTIGGEQ